MAEFEEVAITLNDLEDVRMVLNACVSVFTARDLESAQMRLQVFSKSPLTAELERVKERMDGYLGDYLLEQYEQEQGLAIEEEDDEVVETAEVEEESLSGNPLGTVEAKRQKGRRLTKEEIAGE